MKLRQGTSCPISIALVAQTSAKTALHCGRPDRISPPASVITPIPLNMAHHIAERSLVAGALTFARGLAVF